MTNYEDQYEIQAINYKTLNGFSEKQISFHHDIHYAGYVKKRNEVHTNLKLLTNPLQMQTIASLDP